MRQNFLTKLGEMDDARRQLENALCIVRKSEFSMKLKSRYGNDFIVNEHEPTLNECFALSASCSSPNGETKGDLELRVAAMVSAGSRQRKRVAISKNLPRCTSVGNLLSNLPIGVISSTGVKARTCLNDSAFALEKHVKSSPQQA